MIARLILLLLLGVTTTTAAPLDLDDLESRALAGDRQSIQRLCYGYFQGVLLPQDYRKAYLWCEIGAEADIPSSQTLLAEMFRFGYYVAKDDSRARRWYLAAAELGHVHAQYMVGHMAMLRAGSPADITEMCFWLGKASHARYKRAVQELADVERRWSTAAENPARRKLCEVPQ